MGLSHSAQTLRVVFFYRTLLYNPELHVMFSGSFLQPRHFISCFGALSFSPDTSCPVIGFSDSPDNSCPVHLSNSSLQLRHFRSCYIVLSYIPNTSCPALIVFSHNLNMSYPVIRLSLTTLKFMFLFQVLSYNLNTSCPETLSVVSLV